MPLGRGHLRLQNPPAPIDSKSSGMPVFNACRGASQFLVLRLQSLPPNPPGSFGARLGTPQYRTLTKQSSKKPPPAETTRVHSPALRGLRIQLFLRLVTTASSSTPTTTTTHHPLILSKFLSSKGELCHHLLAFKTELVENKHKCLPSTNPLRHSEQARMKSMGDCKSTNLGRDRLRSVDRNNKTTLLLTRRCGTNKSYAKDLSPRMVKLQDVS